MEDDDIDNIRSGTQIISDSLKEAVDYFVVATAFKYKRELKSHSSMLIHIDLVTAVHGVIETLRGNM